MAEEQNIASLIQLSKDLLAFEVQNFGIEEIAYRYIIVILFSSFLTKFKCF